MIYLQKLEELLQNIIIAFDSRDDLALEGLITQAEEMLDVDRTHAQKVKTFEEDPTDAYGQVL